MHGEIFMSRRKYAERTYIGIDESKADISRIVAHYGGDRIQIFAPFMRGTDWRQVVVFDFRGYSVSFGFNISDVGQERKRLYRAAFLCIKAKLEAVDSGIESPEQAFYAHILDADGELMFEKTRHLLPVRKIV
jgi:hypothetical protein